MKKLTLAAAQITCQDGRVRENLVRATQMAEQAQTRGAQLVLSPEFMPQGYLLTSALWDSADSNSPGREIIHLMEFRGSFS